MISVEEAEAICLQSPFNAGREAIALKACNNRVLAEQICADRDFPPFDRSTMDGIAINFDAYAKGQRRFKIIAVQAAGQLPNEVASPDDCVEIMTGAAVPPSTGTVVPYELITIENDHAVIGDHPISIGQNVHMKGKDARRGQPLVKADQWITPAVINVAASVGLSELQVRKKPRVMVLSTGDELVEVNKIPTAFQLRRSNGEMIASILDWFGIHVEIFHVIDELSIISNTVREILEQADVLLITGGVSMGKFDFLPQALKEVGVKQLFHKVRQKPGKPFWFGRFNEKVAVFGFPGNPVSTFTCMHRYFIPWLLAGWQLPPKPAFAVLDRDVNFKPQLQYFIQVQLSLNNEGNLVASPIENNGSGDLISLVHSNALMELPAADEQFFKGAVYRIWPFDRPAYL